jgi:hypothetical protein
MSPCPKLTLDRGGFLGNGSPVTIDRNHAAIGENARYQWEDLRQCHILGIFHTSRAASRSPSILLRLASQIWQR